MRVDLELRMGVIKMQTKTFLSSLKDLHIWQGLSLLAFVVLGMGCAQVRYAQTDLEQAIDNPVTKTFPWGEVYCGRGTVCAEVEVLRVDIEPNDERLKSPCTIEPLIRRRFKSLWRSRTLMGCAWTKPLMKILASNLEEKRCGVFRGSIKKTRKSGFCSELVNKAKGAKI